MTITRTPYIELTCNGRINNIRRPNCPSVSDGGFDEAEVLANALADGWTEGRGHLCPGCSRKQAPTPEVAAPPTRQRKTRNELVADAPQDRQEYTG